MAKQDYKRPALYPETFKRLEYYRLENDLNTPQEAVEHLLDQIDSAESSE